MQRFRTSRLIELDAEEFTDHKSKNHCAKRSILSLLVCIL